MAKRMSIRRKSSCSVNSNMVWKVCGAGDFVAVVQQHTGRREYMRVIMGCWPVAAVALCCAVAL